jgi:hypothetical protein
MGSAMNKTWICLIITLLALNACSIITPAQSPTPTAAAGVPLESQGKMKLFILAGQSNMSGRGKVPDELKHSNPRVFVFGNDYQWRLAEEPVDSAAGQVDRVSEDLDAGMSPGLSFAERLLEAHPDWLIGLIPCAKNSSSINAWQRDERTSSLYGSCLKRARLAMAYGKPAGLLFYQGETDTTDPGLYPDKRIGDPAEWASRFAQMVSDWRSDLGAPGLPVVFAQLASNGDPTSFIHWEAIRAQQASVTLPNVGMIRTDDLELGDAVHLTVAGYLEVGRRFAEAYLEISK